MVFVHLVTPFRAGGALLLNAAFLDTNQPIGYRHSGRYSWNDG